MAETFYIHLKDHDRVSWWSPERGPEQGTLDGAAEKAGTRRSTVLVPAAAVTLTRARVPTANRQRMRQAVPFALEEQLAVDVDRLHFALGQRNEDGWVSTAVVDRECMDGWQSRFQDAGFQLAHIVPDVLTIPLADNEWSLLLSAEGALLRTGEAGGYAFECSQAALMMQLALEQSPEEQRPSAVRLFCCGECGATEVEQALTAIELEVHLEQCASPEEVFARGVEKGLSLDLMQGDYSRREQLGKVWRPWRPAAVMLGVLLLLQGGMAIATYSRLSAEAETLSDRIEEAYRQAFPNARHIVDPRLQMEQELKKLQGGGQAGVFSQLLIAAAPILHKAEKLELAGLRYGEGSLQLDLRIDNLQALDTLKQQLAEAGLTADIESANSQGGHVESRLTIRGKGQ